MPYFRIDDAWWSHPKTLALSPAARDLWVRAGSYSMQHLTDGLLSKQALATLGAKPKLITELVDVGYWNPILTGYQFHDWSHYQESADVLRERRDKARERMRNLRNSRSTESSANVRANTSRTEGARSRDVPDPYPYPSPSTQVTDEPSVPETSRETGSDPVIPDMHYIEAGIRQKVDFRKILARIREQAPDAHVSEATAWAITAEVLDRAKSRAGDRTGVVLTSLERDWASWSQLVYQHEGQVSA